MSQCAIFDAITILLKDVITNIRIINILKIETIANNKQTRQSGLVMC